MLRGILLAALIAVPAVLAAQGAAPARPGWIDTLPELPGRLYALGTADLGGNEGDAITRASGRARLEVVARLQATVKGETSVVTKLAQTQRSGTAATAAEERQVRDVVSVGAKAEDLPGLVVERTHTDRAARTVYALAYLDLAQAAATLSSRLDQARTNRVRVGEEMSRRARWQLRRVKADLDGIEASLALLAPAGVGSDFRPALQSERTAVDTRLQLLDSAALPPLDLAKTAMALRTNVDLPPGIDAYLESQIRECGLIQRNLNPDLILDLNFSGGAKGCEFIYADLDIFQGTTYRIDATLTILERSGTAVTRPVPLQVEQSGSPEGMVNEFRRLFERRLPKLVAEVQAELQ
ncbi:MAG: hypothetical protein ABSH53_12620 [Holophaga sp.]|jgi:hypothetical protein